MAKLSIQQALELGNQHCNAGRLSEAEAAYRQVLAEQPNHPYALNLLGLLAHRIGQIDLALELIRRAVAANPMETVFQYNLGIVLRDAGQLDEAVNAFGVAVKLKPDFAEAYNNLGLVLRTQGRVDEAVAAMRDAVRCAPTMARAYNNYGIALHDAHRFEEAVDVFHSAIRLQPDYAGAYCNLGSSLSELRRFDEAIAATRVAIRLKPDFAFAHNNLGDMLKECGDLDQAIASYRQGVELAPDNTVFHSNLVYAMLFHAGADAMSIFEESRRWSQRHAQPLKEQIRSHTGQRSGDRRLRVGYVSPDLRDHVIGWNLVPLFQHHDRTQFEVFCYADVRRPDAISHRLMSHADHWQSIVGLTTEQVAGLIRRDGIDILVDLSLHLAHNRLPVFARKPAPVQVTFAGYPGTTGLDTIDYRLTDPYLDPPGTNDEFYSEKPVRLPASFWCYDPLGIDLSVSMLPAVTNGFVTFGCLNNFCKINQRVLELWARVLREVPASRLMMLCDPGSHCDRTLAVLDCHGVDRSRVIFVSKRARSDYLKVYHGIDIALDTLPYNGHTTSLDAMWMGVPVVTLVGKTVAGRAGLSQCTNLQLAELVAWTPEEFVQIAVKLAGDLPRLAELRSTLRPRMERSPLMDGPGFARGIEAAYQMMCNK